MAQIAVHLNDAGISVQDEKQILYREPGFALLDDDQLTTGSAAFAHARVKPRHIQNGFWSNLQTVPLNDRRFHHLSAADIVSRQLEHIWQRISADAVVAAVPAYMTTANLSLFLGIASELRIPVAGMVDAAVAATRREYQGAVPVHVDISLHSSLLTRLAQSGQASVDRTAVVEECGMIALYDTWIALIAETFVQQSRFDPLHTAETEQMLQNNLQGCLTTAAGHDTVTMEIDYRGIKHAVELESLELIAAAAPIYHRIVSSLRALYQADETPALQLSDRAARMPGLADILTARVGGDIYLLEPGATTRGLLTRCRDLKAADAAVSLVRTLPWDQSPVAAREAGETRRGGHPTHLLVDNRAFVIDTQPLTLGSQLEDGGRSIDLRQEMPGVSRRHCSLQQENGQCVVRDFSRYGTFLNGHRIDDSAVLQIGDLIRLGTPGYEFRLITTEVGDGT